MKLYFLRISEHQAAHMYTYMGLNIPNFLVFFKGFWIKKSVSCQKDINYENGEGKVDYLECMKPIHNHCN